MSAKVTPVQRLMAAMDRCGIARSEAQWTNGFRAARFAFHGMKKDDPEEDRLYAKEMEQWKAVERADANFKRLAQRLTRRGAP